MPVRPTHRTPVHAGTGAGGPAPTSGRGRVLIAHSDPDELRRLSLAIARDPGLEVVATASDAAAATRAAAEAPVDLALVDAALRGGGPAFVQRLVGTRPAVRCLALTCGADADGVAAMLAAGAGGCLPAGVVAAKVVDALHDVVPREVRLSRVMARWVFAAKAGAPAPEAAGRAAGDAAEVLDIIEHRRFRVVYQPIVDLRTGRLLGVEALARFGEGETARAPDVVLQEADDCGLRGPLERVLAEEALTALDRLRRPAFITINLSPGTVLGEDLSALVREESLDRVVIEVIDHRQVSDYEALGARLRPLREHGLRVAVDDSGHGLASLHEVLRLQPDFIKLNRILTRDIAQDPTRRALAGAMVTIAGEVRAGVIAEGIETEAEMSTLRALGVGLGQGHKIARPAPLEDLRLTPEGPPALEPAVGRATPDGVRDLPPVARTSLRSALRAASALVAAELPGTALVLGLLDREDDRFRVVHALDPVPGRLETGWSIPLAEALCTHVADGAAEGLCGDVALHPRLRGLAQTRLLGVGSYAGAPVELAGAPGVASLALLAPEPERLGRPEHELVVALARLLADGLRADLARLDVAPLARLKELACSDPVTAALNRTCFAERLEPIAARTPDRYLLRLSVDDVTALREQQGHVVADLVLRTIAGRLAPVAADGTRLGRTADGELTAITGVCDELDAGRLGRRIAGEARHAVAGRGVQTGIGLHVERLADATAAA